MKRLILIGGIVAIALLGGVWFWFTHRSVDDSPSELLINDELPQEEVAREDLSLVFNEHPALLDFVRLAEDQLVKEVEAEQTNFARRVSQPIEELSSLREAMQIGLTEGNTVWCPQYLAQRTKLLDGTLDRSGAQAWYEEEVAGERSVRGEGGSVDHYEEWNNWLLRLAEASAAKKKTKKAAEAFQDTFNEVTDDYETVLTQEQEQLFRIVDASFQMKPERYLWAATLFQELEHSLPDRETTCTSGWSIDAAKAEVLSQRVKSWQSLLQTAQQSAGNLSASFATPGATLDPKSKQALRQLSTALETALAELQGTIK